jgi:hypothetical protein
MYDRPTALELLEASRQHWETQIIPLARDASFKLYFQSLVAVNVLRIVEREIQLRGHHLRAEWTRLNMLTGSENAPADEATLETRLQERNALLCQQIRAGQWDDHNALFEHLKACAIEQLEVANPRYLQTLAESPDAR